MKENYFNYYLYLGFFLFCSFFSGLFIYLNKYIFIRCFPELRNYSAIFIIADYFRTVLPNKSINYINTYIIILYIVFAVFLYYELFS
jgi:hypothetical protein